MCKSAVRVIWRLICKLEPRRADARAGLPPTAGVDGFPKATTGGFAACAGDDDSFWACCLVHIVFSLSGWKSLIRLRLGGGSVDSIYPCGWDRRNGELKLSCARRNWPKGQVGAQESSLCLEKRQK